MLVVMHSQALCLLVLVCLFLNVAVKGHDVWLCSGRESRPQGACCACRCGSIWWSCVDGKDVFTSLAQQDTLIDVCRQGSGVSGVFAVCLLATNHAAPVRSAVGPGLLQTPHCVPVAHCTLIRDVHSPMV